MAFAAARRTVELRAGKGYQRFYGRRHCRSAFRLSASGGCYRQTVDGRDECGGRFVRFRENVPAAGGESRAHDEKGSGHSSTRYRSREIGCSQKSRKNCAGNRERRCARYRKKHRFHYFGLQQLRDHRFRRDDAYRKNSGNHPHGKSRYRGIERTYYTVTRRDVHCCRSAAKRRIHASAAYRRSNYIETAQRAENRPEIYRRAGCVRKRRIAKPGRGFKPYESGN